MGAFFCGWLHDEIDALSGSALTSVDTLSKLCRQ